jgi:hypothetical protein
MVPDSSLIKSAEPIPGFSFASPIPAICPLLRSLRARFAHRGGVDFRAAPSDIRGPYHGEPLKNRFNLVVHLKAFGAGPL